MTAKNTPCYFSRAKGLLVLRKGHPLLAINFGKAILAFASLWMCLSSSSSTAQQNSPIFDVVSIRPTKPDSSAMIGAVNENEYRAIGMPLGSVVLSAYLPYAFRRRSSLVGAPAWLWKDRYDFVAKVAPEDTAEWRKLNEHWDPTVANKMQQAMLRDALQRRCKLVVHRVPGEIPGFALVVDKHGINRKRLKDFKPGEEIPAAAQKLPLDGMSVPIMPNAEPAITYYGASMASFAAQMSMIEGTPIQDRTRVTGKYDFKLARWRSEDGNYSFDYDALGLKLQPIKIPIDTIVVDHIEKPSTN